MKIEILACESMGTRSMATKIMADIPILIDPGIALAPKRYGLPPHPFEIEALNRGWSKIKKELKRTPYVVITHYHFDHFNPQEINLLFEKTLFLKDSEDRINFNQKRRAYDLLKKLEGKSEIVFADGRTFKIGRVEIRFSKPLLHGSGKGGYVLAVSIRYGRFTFLHTSDVEGKLQDDFIYFVEEIAPQVVFLDGPLTHKRGEGELEGFIYSLEKLLKGSNIHTLIIDHHFMRDLNWRENFRKIQEELASVRVRILNGAQFMGVEVRPFEAMRKELFKGENTAKVV